MRCNNRLANWHLGMLIAGVSIISYNRALAVTATVSFQNGVNSYTGTFDRYISEDLGASEVNGSTVTNYNLNSYNASTGAPDQQGLIRFDDIFGDDAGQIPMGAYILDAHLQLVTVGGANPAAPNPPNPNRTAGPWGVAGLLAPFDSTTSYFTDYPSERELGGYGAWWEDGHATRPVGGYGRQHLGEISQARVTAVVQQWSDGDLDNNGLVVQAGFEGVDDDGGWGVYTTGHSVPQARPKLSVTYTTDPVEVKSFQPGVGAYDVVSVTMARVLGNEPGGAAEHTVNGSGINAGYLDGADASTAEQLALIKFENVFGGGAGQVPFDKPVAKGWLVLTTNSGTGDVRSPDAYDVHIMNQDWDVDDVHSSFGATPGLQITEGEISQAIDRQVARIMGSEVWYDVTEYLEGVRNNPANDFGLAVLPKDTNGWQINFNGATDASTRPRLVVASQLASADPGGDFNNDGSTDAADYVMWRKTNSGDMTAYNTWRQNFGSTGAPQGPAEPATVVNYDLVGISTAVATAPATKTAEGVTGLALTRGPGVNASLLNHGFAASNWTTIAEGGTIDRARAIANGDYFQWGVTLDASHTASLSELEISSRRSALNGPSNYEVQVSLDGFASAGTVVESFTYFGRVSGDTPDPNPALTNEFYYMTGALSGSPGRPDTVTTPSDPFPTIDLTDISALQNIAPGTTVTFRLYAWNNGQTGAASTNTVGFRMNGPKLTGFVTSISGSGQGVVPEPTSAVLAGLFSVAFASGRRQRRCA